MSCILIQSSEDIQGSFSRADMSTEGAEPLVIDLAEASIKIIKYYHPR